MCYGCVGQIFGPISNLQPGLTRRAFLADSVMVAGAAAAAMALPGAAWAATGAADTIFRGGPVIPMAGSSRYAEAMAVAGGKIVAVGSDADVMALKGGATKIIDLGGRTALPGFIDPHTHTVTGALITAVCIDVGYPAYKSRAEVFAAVKAKVDSTPPGTFLYFNNFDNLLQGGDPALAELDALAPAHPVMLYYINLHTAVVNSAALKAAGVGQDIGPLPGGARFGRDAAGKLDGMVYEEDAVKKMLVGMPKITPEFAGRAMMDWLKANAAVGNTTLHEPGVMVFGNLLEGYERVAAVSPCRTSISLMFDSMVSGNRYKDLPRGARASQVPGTLMSLYAIKIVGDGSNQTRTAAQTEPYLGGTDKGGPNFNAADMHKMVAEVKAQGWPVSVHCNGDAALDIALDAIEANYGANPPTGVNRIEHCTLARTDQVARMQRLGVQPSFLMNHVHYYGAAYRDSLFGPARASRMDAAADYVKAGVPFTLHTDAPCSNIGTLQLVQAAVTRRCIVDGSIVGPEQAVSLTEALKAVTINAAGQIGMAERIGSLETGKEADITILESDPYKVDPGALMGIKVSETWVAGRKMHG